VAIITISRGTYAGGERLAQLLAERLGYRSVSREHLYQHVAEHHGFSIPEAEEIMEHSPDPFDLLGDARSSFGLGHRRRQLVFALRASLCELLQDDRAIYHGYAGHLLLRGISHLLRVRLIAPRGLRITMAMERNGIGRPEALELVSRVDAERARWTLSLFGLHWDAPSIFDMVLNLERMSLEEAADLTVRAVELPSYRSTDGSHRAMENLRLSSQVMARLLSHSRTAHLDLRVQVDGSTLLVFGRLGDEELARVAEVAREVAGVASVRTAN
jgi:cytidylate kinase